MATSLATLDSVFACAVCVGAPGHAATWGMNMAIGLMLTIVAFILGGIIAFMIYLARKAKEAEALERAGAFDIVD